MKHIKSWQERVNHGDSIYAKATALECEVAELRAAIASQAAAQAPVAWVHQDDPARVISAAQKDVALRDGGAWASSVAPYTVAAFAAPAEGVPSRPKVLHRMWYRFRPADKHYAKDDFDLYEPDAGYSNCIPVVIVREDEFVRAFAMVNSGSGVKHIYAGNCPDENQPDARDPECPACRASQPVEAQSSAYEQDLWLHELFRLIEAWRDTRDGTPSKAEAWAKLWRHGHNIGPHWRARAYASGTLGTGSAAGHSTSEFSSLSNQAHGYGVRACADCRTVDLCAEGGCAVKDSPPEGNDVPVAWRDTHDHATLYYEHPGAEYEVEPLFIAFGSKGPDHG